MTSSQEINKPAAKQRNCQRTRDSWQRAEGRGDDNQEPADRRDRTAAAAAAAARGD